MSLLGNREQDGYMLGILIATAAGEKLAILSRLRVAPCHKYGYITSPCHIIVLRLSYASLEPQEEIIASEFLRFLS